MKGLKLKKWFLGIFNKPKKELTPERRKKRKRRRIILLSILSFLVVLRLIMPFFLLKYVNHRLANLRQYHGHTDDIDLQLYKGAYVLKNVTLLKRGAPINNKTPFFTAPNVDFSVHWGALLDGDLVGEITINKPILNFVKGAHKGEDIRVDSADFSRLIKELMPMTVNHFDVIDGELHYIDKNTSPNVHINMINIMATGTNLANVEDRKEPLFARLNGSGDFCGGTFLLNTKFDAIAKRPTFDLNSQMKGLNLVLMNDVLRAYGNFDVKKGDFNLDVAFTAKNGKFDGYITPTITHLDVVQWNKAEGNIRQILWETLIGFGAKILQDRKTGELAIRIPVSGTFRHPHFYTWSAIGYLLRNAFLQAIKLHIDFSIFNKTDKEKKTILRGATNEERKENRESRQQQRKEKRKSK